MKKVLILFVLTGCTAVKVDVPTAYTTPGDFTCDTGVSVCDCLVKLTGEGRRVNAQLKEISKMTRPGA